MCTASGWIGPTLGVETCTGESRLLSRGRRRSNNHNCVFFIKQAQQQTVDR